MKYLSLATVLVFSGCGYANAETTMDHFKQVINKTPYQVEVCTDRTTSGDRTGDALMGAIIGGALGIAPDHVMLPTSQTNSQ